MNKSHKNRPYPGILFSPIAVAVVLLLAQVLFAPGAKEAKALGLSAEGQVVTSESGTIQLAAAHALYIPAVQQGESGQTPVVTTPTREPSVTSTATPTPSVMPTETPIVTVTPSVTPPVTATPTATVVPTPERLGKEIFVESAWQTNSSSLVVDGQGGLHLAYVHYEPLLDPDPFGDNNPTSAVYASCAAQCEIAANWQRVTLGEAVSEVQLELTPAGDPRLLLLARSQEAWGQADRYLYAECDDNCITPAQWRIGTVVTVPNHLSWNEDPFFDDRSSEPKHYFALDPEGKPRFIYYHYNVDVAPEGIGTYYAACESDCSDPWGWTHTRMTLAYDSFGTLYWEEMHNPALAFTQDGRPRVLAFLKSAGILTVTSIAYYECDVACDSGGDGTANWKSLSLQGVVSAGPSDWDLEVDADDGMHIVLYLWPAPQNTDALQYGWCASDCLSEGSWQRVGLGLGSSEGEAPNLELNEEGQPRLAYTADEFEENTTTYGSLFYGWCTANCQSTSGQWQHERVENGFNLMAEWNADFPAPCGGGFWSGQVPALAFAPTGTLHIAYDTKYHGACEYDEASGTWQAREYEQLIWRTVHFISFGHP